MILGGTATEGTGCGQEKGSPECALRSCSGPWLHMKSGSFVAAAGGEHFGGDSAGGVGVAALGWEKVPGAGACGVVLATTGRWGGRGRHRPVGWSWPLPTSAVVVAAAGHDRWRGLILIFSFPE